MNKQSSGIAYNYRANKDVLRKYKDYWVNCKLMKNKYII